MARLVIVVTPQIANVLNSLSRSAIRRAKIVTFNGKAALPVGREAKNLDDHFVQIEFPDVKEADDHQ